MKRTVSSLSLNYLVKQSSKNTNDAQSTQKVRQENEGMGSENHIGNFFKKKVGLSKGNIVETVCLVPLHPVSLQVTDGPST